jgi:CRISPR-associated protein Csm4
MESRAFRLRLRSPLHVGDQGIGSEVTHAYVPSDTLFSAVAVIWRTLPGLPHSLAELLDEQNPPLVLTSAFPYAGNVLLLPRPHLPHAPNPRKDESGKRFRRVRWVSHTLFARLIAAPGQEELDSLWQQGKTVQTGAVWVTANECKHLEQLLGSQCDDLHLWSTGIVPRVAVDRVTNASQIHHTGRASFAEGCGLWCMARGTANWLAALEKVLAVLGDEGLGGERSNGNGQFTLEPLALPSLPSAESSYVVLLSRTAPTAGQMDLLRRPQSAYELVLVGGFSGTPGDSPLVRRQVRMLVEGSIIGAPAASSVLGHLVDVTPSGAPLPDHRIYRSGLGFAVPVQLAAQEEEGQ